jgi:chitin deacetylase
MRKLAYFASGIILLMASVLTLWKIGNSRTYQVFGQIVPRVNLSQKVVALTFDDGPTAGFTDEILQILDDENVKATFFLIGGEMEKHPDEGKKIVAAGNDVGNHSFSHTRMILVTPSFVRGEIEMTDDLIRSAG